jgi:hypothetical protein
MEEAEYVYWSYMGPESVCFYPPVAHSYETQVQDEAA